MASVGTGAELWAAPFDAAEAHELARKLAAFSIDIDGFNDINDVYGHNAGDLLLIEAPDRVRRQLGDSEFLARQSGDEFLVLRTSGHHPDDAAARIADAFARLFDMQDAPSPSQGRAAIRYSRPIRRSATSCRATPGSRCGAAKPVSRRRLQVSA